MIVNDISSFSVDSFLIFLSSSRSTTYCGKYNIIFQEKFHNEGGYYC